MQALPDKVRTYRPGEMVFVPHAEDHFRAAQVTKEFQAGIAGKVKYIDPEVGGEVTISAKDTKEVERMDHQSLALIKDMTELKLLNRASLLHNLRKRYKKKEIYTDIGSILVSVNPYEWIGNREEILESYLTGGSKAPHIFKAAEETYQLLMTTSENQSAVITGESGAGKTEATKMFLEYISVRSARSSMNTGSRTDAGLLEQKIRESNPFVEAFGNAKTLRNDNSSRFGKLTEVFIDTSKGIVKAACVTSYLLEKSRVVAVNRGERNYHIFYQLCAAAVKDRPELKSELGLSEAVNFRYTKGKNKAMSELIIKEEGQVVDDAAEFKVTEAAMKVLNLQDDEIQVVFKILAGILHLGNVNFEEGADTFAALTQETFEGPLKQAATHLGVDPEALGQGLVTIDMTNSRDTVFRALTVKEASSARDALSKHIYNGLFVYLIERMNEALYVEEEVDQENQRFIGLLDIFGFEMFEINSFEQLCINYCNEKLQFFFNYHVFKLEQEMYRQEGIDAKKIGYSDNSNVVETIEGGGVSKHKGILTICDEQALLESSSDKQFLGHVQRNENAILMRPRVQDIRKHKSLENAFKLVHFAGGVHYNVEGFLEKNKDTLRLDLRNVALSSSHRVLQELFEGGNNTAKYRKTLGTRFKDSLNRLMKKLNSTNPHFVRTIKPNHKKAKNNFNSGLVFKQLNEAGLLEVCKISKHGYQDQRDHEEFFKHFLCLGKSASNVQELVDILAQKKFLYGDNLQIGKTKVFMRVDQAADLEHERIIALKDVLCLIKNAIRSFLVRSNLRMAQESMQLIKKAMVEKNGYDLQRGLEYFLEKGLTGLPLIQRAKEMMKELEVHVEILKGLEEALAANDIPQMKAYIEEAKQQGIANNELVERCKEAVHLHERSKEMRHMLEEALASDDVEQLQKALAIAKQNKMEDLQEYQMAAQYLSTLSERVELLEQLREAMEAMNHQTIREVMAKLIEIGTPENDLMRKAQMLHQVIVENQGKREEIMGELTANIEKALENKDLPALKKLQLQAYELQYSGSLLNKMNRMIVLLERKQELFEEVDGANKVLKRKMQSQEGIKVDAASGRDDLAGLRHALKMCLEDDVEYEEEKEIKEGAKTLKRAEEQIVAQKVIAKTLKKYLNYDGSLNDNPSINKLEEALQLVFKLGLQTVDAINVVREWRKIEELKALAEAMNYEANMEIKRKELVSPDAKTRENHVLERIQVLYANDFKKRAKDAYSNKAYTLDKYYRVRSDEDFVELEDDYLKSELKKKKLYAQRIPISKSMLAMDDARNLLALRINRNILEYCGDLRAMRNIESRASFVITEGMIDELMADEIFVQLCKHCTGNPVPQSADAAWRLLCQCATFSRCSQLFEPFLLHFLKSRATDPGIIGNYAKFALAQLSSSLALDHKNLMPVEAELNAYLKRPPVFAEIERVDGGMLELPIAPVYTLKMLLRMIRRVTRIKDNLKNPEWGIYIQPLQSDALNFHKRVYRFFAYHNESKLYKVDKFVEFWQDKPEEFFKQLIKAYGPEPPPTFNPLREMQKRALADKKVAEDDSDDEKESSVSDEDSDVESQMVTKVNSADLHKVDEDELIPSVAWPLPWWVRLGDVVGRMYRQNRVPKMTFKRRLLKPRGRPDNLLYQQLLMEFKNGNLPLEKTSNTVDVAMTSLALKQLEEHGEVRELDKQGLREEGFLDIIPATVVKTKNAKQWLKRGMAVDLAKYGNSKDKLRQHFYEEIQRSPKYGMSFFVGKLSKASNTAGREYITEQQNLVKDDQQFMVGFNQNHILFQHNNITLYSIKMEAIKEIGTKTGGIFWMKTDKKSLTTHSAKGGEDPAGSGYSSDNSSEAGKNRKSKRGRAKKLFKRGMRPLVVEKSELIEVYTLMPKEMFDIAWLLLNAFNQ